ncbi:uncharacterized protein [Scyliorhinus torazame]|uniref:uncharacterized protein n=1 Tax=Scyliorhinus torazame TaxID=75743 RepID=UPI003B58D174
MDETGTSPGSVGGYGCAYSSGQSDFAETSDMAFVIKDVGTGASASVALGIPESEADSHDDLERLNASGDAWLSSVEERDSSEESVPKKHKGRTIFSADQLRVLQQHFQLQRYVTASERQDLGSVIGLTSQQVKTWFQNRRMKMKRALKEPIAVPQTGFLHADLSQNNPVVFGMPSDYMKHQFNGYSLPQLLPRQLAASPSEQWPSPGSMYPGLGKFQSTVIKSELQYINQSLNFSIKKEAIALSSRPELEPMKIPVTSYSHGIPVQHFSLQRALPRPGHFQQGLSYEMPKPAGDELHYEKVIIS